MNSRLTFHSPDGSWGLNNGYDMKKVPSELYGALWKLKDYEDTGLQPDQIEQMNDLYLDKCEEVNELEKQLEELHRTAGQRSDWIPCSERLPEENEVVILTFRNGAGLHVGEATYKKKMFFYVTDTGFGYYEEVYKSPIAWQPLPKPYGGKEL